MTRRLAEAAWEHGPSSKSASSTPTAQRGGCYERRRPGPRRRRTGKAPRRARMFSVKCVRAGARRRRTWLVAFHNKTNTLQSCSMARHVATLATVRKWDVKHVSNAWCRASPLIDDRSARKSGSTRSCRSRRTARGLMFARAGSPAAALVVVGPGHPVVRGAACGAMSQVVIALAHPVYGGILGPLSPGLGAVASSCFQLLGPHRRGGASSADSA